MYRPHPFMLTKLHSKTELGVLLQKGPVTLMSDTPTIPDSDMPANAHATLLYSEFPLARWGHAAAGTDYLHGFEDFRAHHGWLKMPRLAWVTLYRVEATRS